MHGRMPRPRLALAVLASFALAAFGLASSTAFGAAWSHDPNQNLPLVVAPRGQCPCANLSDMNGGAIVFWYEPCSLYTSPGSLPTVTIHGVHLLKRGDVDPAWPAFVLSAAANNNLTPSFLADSLGGFYAGWGDLRNLATTGRDVYLLHFRKDGTPDPAWPLNGRAICTAIGNQLTPLLVGDAQGGVIAAWSDRRDTLSNNRDIYATHVLKDGTLDPAWPANGRAIYSGPASQILLGLVPDGAGGAIAVWNDNRNSPPNLTDVYVQRVRADGTIDPAWPTGGVGVAATTHNEFFTSAAADAAGGVYVSWEDTLDQIGRMTRVLGTGVLDPAWPAGGPNLDTGAQNVFSVALMRDSAHGVFAAFGDILNPSYTHDGVALRHLLSNGVFDPIWPALPVRVSNSASTQNMLSFGQLNYPLITDHEGGMIIGFLDGVDDTGSQFSIGLQRVRGDGALDSDWSPHGRTMSGPPSHLQDFYPAAEGDGSTTVAWSDLRDSASTYLDVYAQRITKDGHLGLAEAAISKVKDVPNDQGGHTTVFWYASAYDTLPADPVTEYDVWRQLNAAPAQATRLAQRADAREAPHQGDVRVTRDGAKDVFWEFLGSAPPRGTLNYALTIATRADSSAAGPAREVYEVDLHGTALNYISSSDPDSGYSVDNLAPPVPSGFAGNYAAGTAQLLWNPSLAFDLANYRLYRGASAGFTPSPANRIASPTTTNYTDPAGTTNYYKLSAIDIHGNESAVATLLPTGALAADYAIPTELSLARPAPDPAHVASAIRYSLPRATAVELQIFDAAGRRVRTLAAGVQPAGWHQRTWDLRDDAGGAVGAGLYFVRLRAENRTFTQRIAALR